MRLKDLVSINQRTLPETTRPDYAFRYVEISSVDSNGTIQNLEEMTFDSAPSRARRLVKRDDVIVSTVRTYLRAIGAIDSEATDIVVSTGFAVCTPNEKVVPKYLNYTLRCDNVMDEICKDSSGISYPAINATKLSSIEIPYLDIPEQHAIVAYLDEKAAAIDRKVALLEKKLAAFKRLKTSIINRAVTRGLDPNVKLKDSGVDWIGQVPEGWGVSRVGSHYSIQLGKMLSSTRTNHDETLEKYYCAANVHYEGISGDVKEMWFSQGDKSAYKIHVGDMLVVEGGAGAGGCAIVERLDCDTYIQNSILRLRGDNLSNNKYLCYWFQNLGQRGYIEYACNVATIPHFTKEKMRQVPMPVPSLEAQCEIVLYLDVECAKIDKAAAIAEKQIDAYRRLKRSLINEVVTGKRKVA